MEHEEITQEHRDSQEYKEGDAAFANFVSVDDCPYDSAFMGSDNPQSKERTSWMAGWYDAKYRAVMPHLFDPDSPNYRNFEKSKK